MKDNIVERLLELKQISVGMADIIINNREGKSKLIDELKEDGYITWGETIILLKEIEIPYPKRTTDKIYPYVNPPGIQEYPDWTYDPHRPGQPRWEVTCSNNLNDVGEDE